MIDRRKLFDKPSKSNNINYENRKVATGQEGDYILYCLLGYPYYTENYKSIAINFSK